MITQQTAPDVRDRAAVAVPPARRVPLLVAIPVLGVTIAALTAGVLLTNTPKPAPQPLDAGTYACTRPDPAGGPPRSTGQLLESVGPGHYWFHPATGSVASSIGSGTGNYAATTIEQGQYDLRFASGPLRGTQGDFVMLRRAAVVVSYVVLAGGSADGLTCTLQQ